MHRKFLEASKNRQIPYQSVKVVQEMLFKDISYLELFHRNVYHNGLYQKCFHCSASLNKMATGAFNKKYCKQHIL